MIKFGGLRGGRFLDELHGTQGADDGLCGAGVEAGGLVEEADETDFWIELGERAGVVETEKVAPLRRWAEELVKIFAATCRTARSGKS
jgi:hypothetical protein